MVKVTLDSTSNFFVDFVLDSLHITGDTINRSLKESYDTNAIGPGYFVDSIQPGKYTLTMSSAFGRKYSIPVSIPNDSLVFIKKEVLRNFTKSDSKLLKFSSTNPIDSIIFLFTSAGCFRYLKEKITIWKYEKYPATYAIELFSRNLSSDRDFDFFHTKKLCDSITLFAKLNELEAELKEKMIENENSTIELFSTTSHWLDLVCGNTLYEIRDKQIDSDWDSYWRFRTFLRDSLYQ